MHFPSSLFPLIFPIEPSSITLSRSLIRLFVYHSLSFSHPLVRLVPLRSLRQLGLRNRVQGIKVAGASASVIALDFCSLTKSLAIGNECGLVRVYKLSESSNETCVHFVIENKHEGLPSYIERVGETRG